MENTKDKLKAWLSFVCIHILIASVFVGWFVALITIRDTFKCPL